MLTTTTLIESTVTYGIVHGIWVGIKILGRRGMSEMRKERNRIIHNHVKTGHGGRLKHCLDEACASLRNPASPQPVPRGHSAARTDS